MSATTRTSRRDVPSQLRLFDAGQMTVTPSVSARLLRLSSRPARPATAREARSEEDRATMDRLRGWGRELAAHFGLRWAALEPEREGVHGHYGICYADGVIRIRLRHARTGRLLKESSLVDTLCHEISHLRHFDHSPRFWRYYRRVLDEARRRGIYRPGPQPGPGAQRSLFELVDGPCGTADAATDPRRPG